MSVCVCVCGGSAPCARVARARVFAPLAHLVFTPPLVGFLFPLLLLNPIRALRVTAHKHTHSVLPFGGLMSFKAIGTDSLMRYA